MRPGVAQSSSGSTDGSPEGGAVHAPGSGATLGSGGHPGRLFDREHILRELRQMLAGGNSISLQEGWEACLQEADPTLPETLFGTGE